MVLRQGIEIGLVLALGSRARGLEAVDLCLRFGIVGVDLKAFLIGVQGVRVVAHLHVSIAQVLVGLPVIGIGLDRLLEIIGGFGIKAFLKKGRTHIPVIRGGG